MKPPDEYDLLRLFLNEEPLLRALLLSATGDLHASEDMLQTVATVVWEKRDQFDGSRPFRPWVLGIARLEILKWRQRLARSREILSEQALARLAESAEEHAEEIDRRRHYLQGCIAVLEQRQRSILEMKYGEGLTIADIADRVGKSVAAIEMVLVRIRRALRDCIEKKAVAAAGDLP
ncbi:MAG: sigma-70 family RNA polymerase sigma factor [Planctomycetes bacterium]|nr:sigma-70 family RNA polymerase sigma factor [Planctomycetota bacterium]